jgi:hypothetical protein
VIKQIEYDTKEELKCGYPGAGVVIGCSRSLTAPVTCGAGHISLSYIYGTVIGKTRVANLNDRYNRYILQYDDVQLASGALLISQGITFLFCNDGRVQWTLDQIALSKCS